MRPRYNHLSVDSDGRDGGVPAWIIQALWQRVHELEHAGEVLEAVGVPEETIDYETGLEAPPE